MFPFEDLRNALKQNPLRTSASTEETLGKVEKGRAVVFVQVLFLLNTNHIAG
jgi:hypothetical protein